MGEEADGKKHQRLVVSCCSLLRLQYLPLGQHSLKQRLHTQFLRDGDGLVLKLDGAKWDGFGSPLLPSSMFAGVKSRRAL